MRVWARLLFAVLFAAPMILLQGLPELAPAWFDNDVAGLPAVVWLTMLWFAIPVAAIWMPIDDGALR